MTDGPTRPMDFATLLYRQLPEVFRERDNTASLPDGSLQPGDLARLADAWGDLLDALYRTLLQRYYDSFPEQDGEPDAEGMARGCQGWVLPYIARLLDVRLTSPLETGRRLEIGRAVAWRQRKGTPQAIEDIADAVAGMEVEIREGWRRVAVTPCAGFALLPAASFGDRDEDFDPRFPAAMADHPGLPGGTLDLRRASRAIRSASPNSATKTTRFSGQPLVWRQAWRHGVPCFPGSFQDLAVRTVDLRTPDWRRGHAHPRRVVLHAPPFPGFFAPAPASIQWSAIRDAVVNGTALPAGLPLRLERLSDDTGELRSLSGLGAMPVRIRGVVELDPAVRWGFTNLWFDSRTEIWNGRAVFDNCAVRQLHIHTADAAQAVTVASNSLFKRLLAPRSLVSLEHVTVLDRLVAERLQASDCIFVDAPHKDLIDNDVPADGCVRFSRLPHLPLPPGQADPQWLSQGVRSALRVHAASCTTVMPIFWNHVFGQAGCAVLHPSAARSLRFGAEDGGEIGACHGLRYTLREQAVIEKLNDFLPVGIEAVLAPDASLICAPPQPK